MGIFRRNTRRTSFKREAAREVGGEVATEAVINAAPLLFRVVGAGLRGIGSAVNAILN
ncbi:hypothetical protein SAMN04244553_5540 [Nocardia amikacinitolerans]|uniref:Uncharacterized protein n=1 Tax=Nocardia amikacinitolerans TaxID=756689 RepID=A0A285LZ31_9NOCA|nr:hypothetical protein [Nocardia amikacinitolerans]MCP2280292.1 hypothetical protein [Nocardia amikacinitolerans]MCP2299568.1 hypothetical protein [Nocardia amikacinitolerans]SNY88561.1 hypothetical protein SAMN04244553_5540 [Nocardia amikacinitolerans]